ncbi:MAG: ATP-binding cassette domain-containing protein [Acidimicrobiia bacterium]
MTNLFRLEDVSTGHDGRPILRNVDLELPRGGITCIAGSSGAGKTSLLRLLNRLDAPIGGSIWFGDEPLTTVDPMELRRKVAMVFQSPPTFPGTVLDNLRVADPGLDRGGAKRVLAQVDLADQAMLDREADTLSGGEAQRMCLGRALLTSPEVLLADEPTSSLDQHATRALENLISSLATEGISVILVSHDLAQLERMADRVVVLGGGRVLANETLAAVQRSQDPAVAQAIRTMP